MNTRWAIRLGVIAVMCIALQFTDFRNATSQQKHTLTKTDLQSYIIKMGIRLDCYFTIESERHNAAKSTKDIQSKLEQEYVDDLQSIPNINALVLLLQEELPYTIVSRDSHNPMLIRIVEQSLINIPNYPLDQKCDFIYNGRLVEFIESLANKLRCELRLNQGFLSDPYGGRNEKFRMRIVAKNKTVRSILSSYFSLSDESRILSWTQLDLSPLIPSIGVMYSNPRARDPEFNGYLQPRKALEARVNGGGEYVGPNADSDLSFEEGEVAYFFNPKNSKHIGDATNYIKVHLNDGESSQVRWSMLWLGKNKVTGSIPMLIRHLEYRYTTVPVRESAYPVVKALITMGGTGADAALKDLPTEVRPHRMELLSWVVLSVYGLEAGQKKLEAAAKKFPDKKLRLLFKQAYDPLLAELRLYEKYTPEDLRK